MKKIFLIVVMLLLVTIVVNNSYAQVSGYSMSNPINAGTYSVSGSFTNSVNSSTGGFTNNYGNAANDVWYKFTINSTANSVLISLCGSSFDTYLHVLNSSGTEIYSNDDNGPACATAQSSISISSLAPGTYYVDAEGYSNYSGTIDFSLTATIVQPPVISYGSGAPYNFIEGTAISALTPTNTGGAVASANQTLTFAGTGYAGQTDGNGTLATFNQSLGMVMDGQGNLYVADAGSHLIRKVTSSGTVTTIAGNGSAGFTNSTTGTSASFNHPVGLAMDASGNIYVADENNNAIRKISPTWGVTTLAGSGSAGFTNGSGTGATFNQPCGIAVDASGNAYVADYSNNVIRKITSTGSVTTYAGTGTASSVDGPAASATFNHPFDVVIDKSGNLYVTDRLGGRIRKIGASGTVSTLAGTTIGYADGIGTAAQFSGPTSLALDTAGNVYVTDETNQRIRKITPAGVTSTIAGTGTTGNANGVGTAASFDNPFAIAAAPAGYVYVGDQYNYLIRKIITAPYTINPSVPAGLSLDSSTGTISGTPTATSATTSHSVTAYSPIGQTAQASLSMAVTNGTLLQLSDLNYIVTYTPRVADMMTTSQVYSNSSDKSQVEVNVQYIDGLGRPVQTIQVKGSPSGKDIVQPMAYDQYGREPLKYLPYAVESTPADGSYKTSAITNQATFYNAPPTGVMRVPTISGFSTASSPIVYEMSPQDKPIEQGAPGAAWQLAGSGLTGSGHTVRIIDTLNAANEVVLYSINSNGNGATCQPSGNMVYYPQATLIKHITIDENLDSTYTYTDELGHMICKTAVMKGVNYSTFYVYDDYGNLTYVIPPVPSAANPKVPSYPMSFTQTSSVFQNYIYGYHYDSRERLVEKKVPGKGWDYMAYNSLDQLVITQDSVLRMKSPQQAIYTAYDAFGRAVMTVAFPLAGTTAGGNFRTLMQGQVNALNTLWETRVTTGNGYTSATLPSGFVMLTTNYYDNYNIPGMPSTCTIPSGASTRTTGLTTAGITTVLNNTANTLWNANFYDDLGRITQTYKQHYLGGVISPYNYDQITTNYDFTNVPTTVTRKHFTTATTSGTPLVTISDRYIYDHMSRKLKSWEQITNGTTQTTQTLLSQATYNEVGQLFTKQLYSTDSLNFLQTVTYGYNERGWLTSSSAPLFAMQLTYNSGAAPQYNGNISAQKWGTPGSLGSIYNYRYDNLNRLISGISNTGNYEKSIVYDSEGNLTGLQRYLSGTKADALKYSYIGNQLQSLSDSTSNNGGYKPGTYIYGYDGNGNMVTDNSKGFTGATGIVYNVLNLPQTISSQGIVYTYSAAGEKLRRAITTGGTTTYTDYIGGIEYDGTNTVAETVTFIQTEEGRAIPNGAAAYNYEYNLSDHLGNVRYTFDTGSGVARNIQQDDYLPFGMDVSVGTISSPQNFYLYNKKEFQQVINLYDFGARYYDPVVGRWTNVDPLAEKYRRWSTYNYGGDNPIRFIDPDGMGMYDWVKNPKGIKWDPNAKSPATTSKGDTYLGKTLTFNFSSYINKKTWDGPTLLGLIDPSGVKLSSTITLTGRANAAGDLTSIVGTSSTHPGETPFGTARAFYPGEGGSNNIFNVSTTSTGASLSFEQHASVSPSEEFGIGLLGYKTVDVAQKLNINYTSSTGGLSISAATDIFPSATLKMNGSIIIQYNQPSFIETHSAPIIGSSSPSSGSLPISDLSYYPSKFYSR